MVYSNFEYSFINSNEESVFHGDTIHVHKVVDRAYGMARSVQDFFDFQDGKADWKGWMPQESQLQASLGEVGRTHRMVAKLLVDIDDPKWSSEVVNRDQAKCQAQIASFALLKADERLSEVKKEFDRRATIERQNKLADLAERDESFPAYYEEGDECLGTDSSDEHRKSCPDCDWDAYHADRKEDR